MKNKVILIGVFIEIIELVEEENLEILGIVDNRNINNFYSYNFLGNDEVFSTSASQFKHIPLIITPDQPYVRERLHKLYKNLGFQFKTVISALSKTAKSAIISDGTIIQYGVNISSEAQIGKLVKLNTYSNIMHNVKIGNYSTIAPNSVILGNVSIGEKCYIGANSTILPNLSICSNTVIGAGAVVTKNIYENGTYIGAPAYKI